MIPIPGRSRRSRRRRWFAATALVALVLLAGCGSGGSGRAAPSLEEVERRWAEDVERQGIAGPPQAAVAAVRREDSGPGVAGVANNPTMAAATYRLNPGDVLQISVWREDELQRQALVQPDGSISFPLIGQVAAAGRTAGEVEAEIAERLDRFIPDAVATVELIEARGNKIYVVGEVNRPGEYQMGGPLTVVQAISLAGGFTQFAARDRIRVLRHDEGGEETALAVDYGRVASGDDVAANIELEAGDTIIVPGKVFGLF